MIIFDKKKFLKVIKYTFLKLTIVSLMIMVIYAAGFYFTYKTGLIDYRLLKFNNFLDDIGNILIIVLMGIIGIAMLAATLGLIILIIYAMIALIVQYLYEKGVLYFTKNDDKPSSFIERELRKMVD